MITRAALLAAALRLLNYYNGDEKTAQNPGGLTGVGGMADNWDPCIQDIGTVANGVGEVAGTIAAAQSTIGMVWDAATTVADPGAGNLRATTATPAVGSYSLLVSATDSAGADIGAMLTELGASSSAIRARARLVAVGDAAKYLDLRITGVTGVGAYRTVGVTCIGGPGGFATGDAVALGWVRSGDKGDTGAAGAGPNWGGTSAGTANAQTLAPAVALGSLSGNPSYEFIAGYSITGAATLNVSGTGDASIRKADGTAAGKGDVVAGTKYTVTLVSGQWRLAGGGGANLAAIHAAMFSI
ncbi:hypothetical protein SAMN02982917_4127 [Azospirillum oryzae]|uniref:Uncharacterized protein n=1 Tax=Azospirillum oryzae TaxID=286727 RepID=A0A1X7GN90_9PROT|nr:hypothetical protein [Azospirillum oryzae]SMF72278.1 hypothetical protein SAMN02982917_4127 [Azospirillum oryzae]